MRAPIVVAVIATVALCLTSTAHAAASSRRCANVLTRHIEATSVTTFGGIRCTPARSLLRRYFNRVVREGQVEGGCAQDRFGDGCAIGDYLCTLDSRGRAGRCFDGKRSIRFRERDLGPE